MCVRARFPLNGCSCGYVFKKIVNNENLKKCDRDSICYELMKRNNNNQYE